MSSRDRLVVDPPHEDGMVEGLLDEFTIEALRDEDAQVSFCAGWGFALSVRQGRHVLRSARELPSLAASIRLAHDESVVSGELPERFVDLRENRDRSCRALR